MFHTKRLLATLFVGAMTTFPAGASELTEAKAAYNAFERYTKLVTTDAGAGNVCRHWRNTSRRTSATCSCATHPAHRQIRPKLTANPLNSTLPGLMASSALRMKMPRTRT